MKTKLTPPPTTDKEWANAKVKEPTLILGDKVFHTGTIGMFVMQADGGKTHWAIGAALAMAYGHSFCEWLPHKPARVLYIEGEAEPYRMRQVIRTQRAALRIKDDEVSKNFSCITAPTHGEIPFLNVSSGSKKIKDGKVKEERDLRGKDWLWEQIKTYRPQFIFFDNLAALAPAMVSTSATQWIDQLVKAIIIPINKAGIGQLWLHHPNKSGMEQHGTAARSWGLNLELYGMPKGNRGINFSLLFPGKKKDDEGDNPDFDARSVAFNRGEDGISRWVIGPITPKDETQMLNALHQKEAGSVVVAREAFLTIVQGKPDVWISGDVKGRWAMTCIANGISSSDKRPHQIKAFTRARDALIEMRAIERRDDGMCRLFPDVPEEYIDFGEETATVGSA